MCDLREKTDLKTVTVYKTVTKVRNSYYSYFAGTKIKLGKVRKQTKKAPKIIKYRMNYNFYIPDTFHYNEYMVGKCSGFEYLEDANALGGRYYNVLKIVLGGEIWVGTTKNISTHSIPPSNRIYAGTEILSFEEV
jgi:hypothetical protein